MGCSFSVGGDAWTGLEKQALERSEETEFIPHPSPSLAQGRK